ncbi:MAG: glucosaminidase, partial [Desulfobulbaceae bacterium]|nr:glucosaminidase [Desulfobulbaceae bacterium]
NNLFGVWTWGEKGIVPESREEGKNHKVAAYDTVLESVRAYILNLNRLAAYSELRRIRKYTMNPLKLADGLFYYSQRRNSYVWEIKDLIKFNNLTKYDKCFLADRPVSI